MMPTWKQIERIAAALESIATSLEHLSSVVYEGSIDPMLLVDITGSSAKPQRADDVK